MKIATEASTRRVAVRSVAVRILAAAMICCGATAASAQTQSPSQPAPAVAAPPAAVTAAKPKYDMGNVQMVMLHVHPGAPPDDGGRTAAAHRARVQALLAERQLVLAGPIEGGGTLREVLVFATDSADAARASTAALPLVQSNALRAEHLTWFTARNVIKPPAVPAADSHYVFGLLVRGADRSEKTPEALKALQAGHMANIERLADAGKLAIAGPLPGAGDRRGVFVFKVDTLEEAKALCDTDPALQAGRLAVELYHWTLPAGSLP